MNDTHERRVPPLLWPFYAVWRLVGLVLELTGRLLCVLLGLVLLAAGISLALTLVAAPLGVPIAALGFLLLVRALF